MRNKFDIDDKEIDRILSFIKEYILPDDKICVFASGGLDSDVVAHLCSMAVGAERVKLVFVQQDGLEEKYLANVKKLAYKLKTSLDVVDLRGINMDFILRAERGNSELFSADYLLDINRVKCSLRTALMSCYQDKGYVIAGASNRSEIELGFFLPLGDNIAHFKPIAHLYKTQVKKLAEIIGCNKDVIMQAPSAAFWPGEEDLLDLAYWLINGKPITGQNARLFSTSEDRKAESIYKSLSQKKLDLALLAISNGEDDDSVHRLSAFPLQYIPALRSIVAYASMYKSRQLMVDMKN